MDRGESLLLRLCWRPGRPGVWKDFVPTLNAKNVLMVPHCLGGECEDEIKKDSAGNIEGQEVDARAPSMGAKSLCIPTEQPEPIAPGTQCINPKCGKKAEAVMRIYLRDNWSYFVESRLSSGI